MKHLVLRKVGFEFFTVAKMKALVLWVVAPCSPAESTSTLQRYVLIALMMEAAGTSETSVNFYQTTWLYYPKDSHVQA
jgi:hypothetical protein